MVESGACQSIGNAASDRVQRAYDDKHTYHIKVINSSARRIGYGIKTTNMKRLGVDPPRGVLDPKEAVSPSSGPTLRMEPPSSSVASGSSETVWCAEREPSNRVQSITRHRDPDKLPKQ
uniref:MSP domain-containing protein n=1 Tax=Caenorhabditis japonica TaxID=281687 RepID=A0A8R1IL13_CAEJA